MKYRVLREDRTEGLIYNLDSKGMPLRIYVKPRPKQQVGNNQELRQKQNHHTYDKIKYRRFKNLKEVTYGWCKG